MIKALGTTTALFLITFAAVIASALLLRLLGLSYSAIAPACLVVAYGTYLALRDEPRVRKLMDPNLKDKPFLLCAAAGVMFWVALWLIFVD